MPTIKTKKEMNLAELIEWGFRNNIENESYKTNDDEGYELYFDAYGTPRFSIFVNGQDTFTVEIEEEITGDTVLPKLVTRTVKGHYGLFIKESINNLKQINFTDVEAFYVPNDDLTMTLIWTKEKGLV
ncbi:hypothetical protein NK211_13065 [Mammaliicoccus sciuri]|uniref:hypothetical protein n=1 Tax=Mammaliicoccus sciuri TaxID=1296 RepID=UPI0020A035DD|nr:hypothetical protein [Mammaliicoccus sciuri]MCP1288309.1 hypothetical protein [Mammaliicoccus sciuri]